MSDYIGTYNGGQFWVADPQVKDICFEEITHALSLNIRFNGHTDKFWSIAQHSLLVGDLVLDIYRAKKDELHEVNQTELYLLGITHDFSEAYMSDIARPFKKSLGNYLKYENNVQNTIYKALGIENIKEVYTEILREADTLALGIEVMALMNPCEQWLKDYDYLNDERINNYKQRIKLECPDIIQARLLNELMITLRDLGINNNYKNNAKLMNIHYISEETDLHIIKNGRRMALVQEYGDKYIIEYEGQALVYTKQRINNTLDLMTLLRED